MLIYSEMILIGSLCAFCVTSTHKLCFSFVTIVLHCASTYKICFSFVAIVSYNICFLFLICPIKIILVLKRRKPRIVIAFVEKTPSEGGGVMKLSPITLSSILICLSIYGLKIFFVTHSKLAEVLVSNNPEGIYSKSFLGILKDQRASIRYS